MLICEEIIGGVQLGFRVKSPHQPRTGEGKQLIFNKWRITYQKDIKLIVKGIWNVRINKFLLTKIWGAALKKQGSGGSQ